MILLLTYITPVQVTELTLKDILKSDDKLLGCITSWFEKLALNLKVSKSKT